MRKILALLLAGAFLISIGCASSKPISLQRQADYFNCNGLSVRESEESLARAGYPIKAKGDTYVQTDWMAADIGNDAPLAYALAGIHSLQMRISVAATPQGVRFSLFQRAIQSNGQAHMNKEGAWDKILKSQEKDATSRKLLNDARSDTCATSKPFFLPPSSHK
jgi:hypothetical protein